MAETTEADVEDTCSTLTERFGAQEQTTFTGDTLTRWDATMSRQQALTLGKPMTLEPALVVPLDHVTTLAFLGSPQALLPMLSVAALELQTSTTDPLIVLYPDGSPHAQDYLSLADAAGARAWAHSQLEELVDLPGRFSIIGFELDRIRTTLSSIKFDQEPLVQLIKRAQEDRSVFLGAWAGEGQMKAYFGSSALPRFFPVVVEGPGGGAGRLRGRIRGSESTTNLFIVPETFIPWDMPESLTEASDD